jgi:S-adenosylmethionine-dependent methyltransferase
VVQQPQPGSRPSPARGAARDGARSVVLWETLHELVDSGPGAGPATEPRRVVDLGGGTGVLAVRLAELGHHVTVVDPSPDALAALHRRAAELAVEERVVGVQGDTSDLLDHVERGGADVVLCHGVLEVVDDPDQALDAVAEVLHPDGVLSVVVAGRLAAVLGRALAGHLAAASTMLASSAGQWDLRADGPRRYTREEILDLLGTHGFAADSVHGLRVLADLVPSAVVDTETGAQGALIELERVAAGVPELAAVASRLMVVARHRR